MIRIFIAVIVSIGLNLALHNNVPQAIVLGFFVGGTVANIYKAVKK